MSARNRDHDAFVEALEADGWTITHDPLRLKYKTREVEVDLAAERMLIGAVKGPEKIAVEIQSFSGASDVRNLQETTGQFFMYRQILELSEPDRRLFLAVSNEVFEGILSEPLGELMREKNSMPVIVYVPETRRIQQWIN